MPTGAPQTVIGDPQPVGQPVVVTEDVVTNCERTNNPNAAKPVEKCDIQRVTTSTQQTAVTATVTQQRTEQRTVLITSWSYPFCFPPILPCLPGPLTNPTPLPPEVTQHPAAPLVQTTVAPGPPIVEVDAVTVGSCMNNPGSANRGNACPVT